MLAAVLDGDVKKVAELMRQDPGFDVNMGLDAYGFTLLHFACDGSQRSAVIPLLLAHPDIDVNMKDKSGWTPFFYTCLGYTSCAREMLKDSRVKVNEPDNSGETPLRWAASNNHIDIIKWWIASGGEMNLGKAGNDKTDVIGPTKRRGWIEVVTLLERFKENPVKTRHAMRVELGLLDELAAEMFALVVFVSDGLLEINDTMTPSPAARYFSIATQLALELQMVLCHRVVGSAKEIISGKDSEMAFKELARKL